MELKPQQVAGRGEAPRAGPGLGGALARGAGRHDARGRGGAETRPLRGGGEALRDLVIFGEGGRKETRRHLVGWREETSWGDFDDFHGGF